MLYLEKITRFDLDNLIRIRKNTSQFWEKEKIVGIYLIKENKKTVGIISLRNNKNYVYIEMIEIFMKNKGYGKKTVEYLQSTFNKPIKGIAKLQAEIFWIKMGAFFENSFKFTIPLKENRKVS